MKTRNYGIVALVILTFFVISFLTNVMGPLIPLIKESFSVGFALAAMLPFFFFIAYGVMSIPAGILVDRFKEKKMMVFSFVLASFGAVLFAAFPKYEIALVSLFLMGTGMAILQVAINPLLRVAGGEENFAFYSVLGQLFFGAASFVSPWVTTDLVERLTTYNESAANFFIKTLHGLVPEAMPWTSIYWVIALVSIAMTIVIIVVKLPEVILKDDEKVDGFTTTFNMLKDKKVILYFLGIFAYVGTEQGFANWMSEFLKHYHGMDPLVEGANSVALFWGMLTVGCFLGMALLKVLDSKVVLRLFTSLAIVCLVVALTGNGKMAQIAFPAAGFSLSVMWSIIVSLALNSVEKHHGTFAGILCTGIAGGAVVSLIVGKLGDVFSLKVGMMFLFITLGYILSISFWAKPLIVNETLQRKKKKD